MPDADLSREYRVFGPPGTGKTTWLSRQARNAVERHGPAGVVIASFTRTAAAEIAGRDTGLSREHVGTLHALCYRALGKPPIAESADGITAWNKAVPEYRLTPKGGRDVDDPYADGDEDGDAPGDVPLAEAHSLRARMVDERLWPGEVRAFTREWEAWKRATGHIDFTDMIALALADIPAAPGSPSVGRVPGAAARLRERTDGG